MAAPMGEDAFQLFGSVVKHVLANWTALQLAVQHGMGGVDGARKAVWLGDAVADYFCLNANLERDEVEDLLEDLLNREFDTVAEDGSVGQIAETFCRAFRCCERRDLETVRRLLPTVPTTALGVEGSVEAEGSGRANGGSEPMDEGSDGEGAWTVVHRSKK